MNQMKLTDIWKRLSGFKVNTASWSFVSIMTTYESPIHMEPTAISLLLA